MVDVLSSDPDKLEIFNIVLDGARVVAFQIPREGCKPFMWLVTEDVAGKITRVLKELIMPSNGFTQTEQAILDILSDGKPHSKKELHACCGPSSLKVVSVHVFNMRKKLPAGHDIVSVATNYGKSPRYQHVRTLASPNNGRN